VPFTFTGFTGNRAFVAQLSDAAGAFGSPTTLGTITVNASAVSSATISGTVPAGLTAGTAYRVRVINILRAITGSSNSNGNLTIVAGAPAKPGTPSGQQLGLCGNVQTTITVPAVSGATAYTWTIPAASTHLSFASTSTTNSVTVNVANGMDGEQLNVTANNVCGPSPVKVVNLWGRPTTRPIVSGPTCVTADSQNVAFHVTNVEAGVTYNWTPSGTIEEVSGQGTATYTVNWKHSNGNVTVSASDACGSTGITRWVVTICASPVTNGIAVTSMLVHVFPNPASSSAQISFTANKETKYVIELADKTGSVLQRRELIAHAGENKLTLDLGKYTNGAYFVNVVGEDRRQTAQIIKTN
jgi:hypothetical protein